MARSQIVSSAKVKLYCNGRILGRVLEFRWESSTPKKAIRGIDQSEPFELAPTTTQCTGSLTLLRLSGDAGAEGAGLTVPFPELSREAYVSLTLVEHATDRVLFTADRCSITGQSWGAAVRGIMTGQVTFEAISWSNEIASAPLSR